jgi:hypothetical protein
MGTLTVQEGEMIRVICNLTGGDPSQHALSWLINGAPFDPSLSRTITVRNFPMPEKGFFLSEMYVRESTTANAGTYSCQTLGGTRANWDVQVFAAGPSLVEIVAVDIVKCTGASI